MTGYDEAAREALRSRKRRWPGETTNYADGYTDACEAKEVQLANSGAVITRQSRILDRVAGALNGPPPDNAGWPHRDLPDTARAKAAELAELRAELAELAGLHRNLFELTDKQTARLAEIGVWLDERHGLHADPEIVFAPEYRRGRGHDVTVYWADGETMARASIDVYGNGDTAVWTLDLVHGGEECECIDCTDDNDEDNNNA